MKNVEPATTNSQPVRPKERFIAAGEHVNVQLYILSGIILVVSIVTHLPLLLVGGSILLLILIITDIWATYSLSNVRYRRQLSEKRVIFGEEITLEISIENAKILPLPVLQIDDTIPRALPIKDQPMRKTLVSNLATDRINEQVMEMLMRMRRSGHAVTLLLVGNNPPPTRIAGITVYYLGGEETWDTLQTTYGHVDTEKQEGESHIEGFQL
jgi:hypothetical protein